MKRVDNLKIVQRLVEICKNELQYDVYPKPFKEEHIFLSNELNYALVAREREFNETFKQCVGKYKSTLEKNKKYGWFNSPENLIWKYMYINQLKYIIYGERYSDKDLVFREELKEMAYLDLINQIDRTALMTEKELKEHQEKCNAMAMEILEELLKEEKEKEIK